MHTKIKPFNEVRTIYLRIYLSICLYCLPTNLFLFISLYFSHLALFGFVCIDWRLYSGAALTSPALSGAVSAARCSSTVPQHCVSSGRCVCSSSGPQTMSSVDWLVCISSPFPTAYCLLLCMTQLNCIYPLTHRLAILDKAGRCHRGTHWRHCLHVHSVQGLSASLPSLEGTQQAGVPDSKRTIGDCVLFEKRIGKIDKRCS